ncbi:disulfide oxidoreductase [Rhabdothermincola salaria]|uniref:disulfide oxidoreductase n=1 Tax=Rhabdothermincola salaria TaxID=2903142 RepID=UPI001E29C9B9|nr:disulfide oxidoreductase [Rhabdothermincola salaria]MCD9625372.1 disulfide oxidoreductase [Rhabdothermincola salaria]
MTVDTFSTFFALLALLSMAGAVAIAVGALVWRTRRPAWLVSIRDEIGRAALWLAWIVATVTTLGSLYYSKVENYLPCELCWYQRIAIYPFAVILAIAAVRRDAAVRVYAVPVLVIGAVISAYHTWIQAYPPASDTAFCTADAPCTARYVWEFGFVSLPFMALSASLVMIALLFVARPTSPASPDPGGAP